MKPQVILLGAPGSGKGTQAAKMVAELGYHHLSTGDLLRKEISEESELGKKVSSIMKEGRLVDDLTVLELLKKNCDLSNTSYIFDGFPRNKDQSKLLDEHILSNSKIVGIYFDIDLDKLAERLVNRRTCGGCGEIYNLLTKKPKENDICDKCGHKGLKQRSDDNEESVKTRLNVFKETIEPVLSFYESKGALKRVDASRSSVEVFKEVKEAIQN